MYVDFRLFTHRHQPHHRTKGIIVSMFALLHTYGPSQNRSESLIHCVCPRKHQSHKRTGNWHWRTEFWCHLPNLFINSPSFSQKHTHTTHTLTLITYPSKLSVNLIDFRWLILLMRAACAALIPISNLTLILLYCSSFSQAVYVFIFLVTSTSRSHLYQFDQWQRILPHYYSRFEIQVSNWIKI